MKKITKYFGFALMTATLLFSCETVELDISENPNELTPSQANPDFYLNALQETFAAVY